MGDGTVRTRRWTRVEYDRLVEAEILGPEERIELLGGELVVKEPQHRPHATALLLVVRALERAFGPGWMVQPQLPIALDDESEPEPDVSVVRGRAARLRRSSVAGGARRRGRPLACDLRSRAQRKPVCARRHRRLLDREPGRPVPRDLPRAGARYPSALRLALRAGHDRRGRRSR